MNRKWLAMATALMMISPAYAGPYFDEGLPPPQYDIGGATEADTLVNYIDRFGLDAPELVRVRTGEAETECDRIHFQRYSVHYVYNGILYGCLIRDRDLSRPVIVYSYDQSDPTFAARILRHEVGHQLGWPADHSR